MGHKPCPFSLYAVWYKDRYESYTTSELHIFEINEALRVIYLLPVHQDLSRRYDPCIVLSYKVQA